MGWSFHGAFSLNILKLWNLWCQFKVGWSFLLCSFDAECRPFAVSLKFVQTQFWQISDYFLQQNSFLQCSSVGVFEWNPFRRVPTQALLTAPTARVFSKKSDLSSGFWSDLRARERGRSVWRQLNNKKWAAARNFRSSLKVDEDGGGFTSCCSEFCHKDKPLLKKTHTKFNSEEIRNKSLKSNIFFDMN